MSRINEPNGPIVTAEGVSPDTSLLSNKLMRTSYFSLYHVFDKKTTPACHKPAWEALL
jgi:hypothetical protein